LNGKALWIASLYLNVPQSTRTDERRYLLSESGIHKSPPVAAHA
jgi:hypothetical protein